MMVRSALILTNLTRLKNKIENNTLEKVRFNKLNKLKLTQVGLFSFFHFMCVAANGFELFYKTHLANTELFLYHSNLSF